MSNRIGLFTAQTRDRDALPIVAPDQDKLLGKKDLSGLGVLTTLPCDSEAVYLFCESLIHVSMDKPVTTDSPPIDARVGTYIAVDRGAVIQIRLMEDKDPNTCWAFAAK